jgi:hypothetical protein
LLTVFPAHAPADAPFAEELSAFLTAGCDAVCDTVEAAIKPGQDLIEAAEEGLSADVLILLLSPESNLPLWRKERWEPVLFGEAQELNTRVAVVLLEECGFPALLRKQLKFFDATADRLTAMRKVKRWLRGGQAAVFSPNLDILYQALADRPGTNTASGEMAERFFAEASGDFEAVFWIPAYRRTLARIAGELGSQLGMTLDGELEDNCRRIRELLARKRCLVILDAPRVNVEWILPSGRSSVLFTSEPVRVEKDTPTLALARSLVRSSRFAEAYEMLYQLLDSRQEMEACARDLVWICEHWGRLDESNKLRFHYGPSPSEQLHLF